MNALVDVLAVLREARELRARTQDTAGNTFDLSLARIDIAMSAVAELVAADVAYDLARGALEEYYRQVAEKGYMVARFFDARALAEGFVRADDHRAMVLLKFAPIDVGGVA